MDYFELMKKSLDRLNIDFDREKYEKFTAYKDLIKEWNTKINLTAITEDEEIFKKHFLDCIEIFSFDKAYSAGSVIDVGTGAGFPGIPMKIINPDIHITLLDSLNKRLVFLQDVIDKLGFKDIEVVHARAEEAGRDKKYRGKYDIAVSRAVANMNVLSEYCIPFVKNGGYFIAMKGPQGYDEMEKSKNAVNILGAELEKIIEVKIEDSDLKHNMLIIKKIKNTPEKYPRNTKFINKKPL